MKKIIVRMLVIFIMLFISVYSLLVNMNEVEYRVMDSTPQNETVGDLKMEFLEDNIIIMQKHEIKKNTNENTYYSISMNAILEEPLLIPLKNSLSLAHNGTFDGNAKCIGRIYNLYKCEKCHNVFENNVNVNDENWKENSLLLNIGLSVTQLSFELQSAACNICDARMKLERVEIGLEYGIYISNNEELVISSAYSSGLMGKEAYTYIDDNNIPGYFSSGMVLDVYLSNPIIVRAYYDKIKQYFVTNSIDIIIVILLVFFVSSLSRRKNSYFIDIM